jgi:hypothetical protein
LRQARLSSAYAEPARGEAHADGQANESFRNGKYGFGKISPHAAIFRLK